MTLEGLDVSIKGFSCSFNVLLLCRVQPRQSPLHGMVANIIHILDENVFMCRPAFTDFAVSSLDCACAAFLPNPHAKRHAKSKSGTDIDNRRLKGLSSCTCQQQRGYVLWQVEAEEAGNPEDDIYKHG